MSYAHFNGRFLWAGACATAALSFATSAQGEPDRGHPKNPCLADYKSALQLEQSARLREAKELLLACAKPACGGFLNQECTAKYMQLEADIPSVVPLVTDDTGAPRVDVQVAMDGSPLVSKLDGVALPVDPGMHEFSFTSNGNVFATQKVLVIQGQRNRPITVSLPTADRFGLGPGAQSAEIEAKTTNLEKPRSLVAGEPVVDREPPPAKPAARVPLVAAPPLDTPAAPERLTKTTGRSTVPFWLGGVGLAGAGAYGMLVYWARTDNMALGRCSPNCSQQSVDHIRRLYLAADISLGVGVAALGTAALFLVTSGPKKAPTRSAYTIDVAPTRSGATAVVSGSF